MRHSTVWIILIALLVVGKNTLLAEVIHVPEDHETIQGAIDASEDGDSVLVAPGEYVENIIFGGKAISVIGNPDNPSEVIIDGDEQDCVVSFENEEDSTSVLSGFTITNGSQMFGGGIDCQPNSSPILIDLIVTGNHATRGGGGIYFTWGADPKIIRTIIKNNSAGRGGGGISSWTPAHAYLKDVVIIGNTARDWGGGIYSESRGSFTLENVLISDNYANTGGGVSLGGTLDNFFYNVTITGNHANNYGGIILGIGESGGGAELNMVNCVVWDNAGVEMRHYKNSEREYPLNISYCDIEDGEDGVQLGGGAELVWGEGNIDEDPQFVDADEGDYHLTEDSPCIDTGDPGSPDDPDRTRADMGAFFFPQDQDLTVSFGEGWNMISINVSPGQEFYNENEDRGPDIERMREQLRIDEENHSVVIMKDERGRFYYPARNFNGIPYWDLTNGYMVNVNRDVEVTWSGGVIQAGADIPITQGWNMIAYYPTYNLDMNAPDFYGISPILDNVIIMKDSRGHFAVPHVNDGFSNMEPLTAGKGYQIKVNQDVVLNYPGERVDGDMFIEVKDYNDHWASPASTGSNMSVLVMVDVSDNCQIATFNLDNLLIGLGGVKNKHAGFAVWGDDPSTEFIDGLIEGEAFELRLWNGTQEVSLDIESIVGNGLFYETDGFGVLDATVADAFAPDQFSLSNAYPNPFNAVTKIVSGLPTDSDVSVQVFNLTGQLITTLLNGDQTAGFHTIMWDADDAPSGIYFVKMEAGEFVATRKLTLLK